MIRAVLNLVRAVLVCVRAGNARVLVDEFRRRLHADWMHFGLVRDLTIPFTPPDAKVPLAVRELRAGDAERLLNMHAPRIDSRGPFVRMHRLNFLTRGIGTCFVATIDDDEPCYMQWLIGGRQNPEVQRYFRGIFPMLAVDEALLEYAFTPEVHQGRGIMPAAMARIACRAEELEARRVITFVDHANTAALKGCQRAGFRPYLLRHDRWRLFRRSVRFTELPAGAKYRFEG